MWLFVETFGAFSELGINTGTFIDGTTPPNQLTLLFYKVMLTGRIYQHLLTSSPYCSIKSCSQV